MKATIALNQTLSCKITDITEPVHVTWKDNDFNDITDSTDGYTIDQGTVDDDNVQTSTLTISTAKLRAMDTSSPLTWRCSVQSLRYPESDLSADSNIVIDFLTYGKIIKIDKILTFSLQVKRSSVKKYNFRDDNISTNLVPNNSCIVIPNFGCNKSLIVNSALSSSRLIFLTHLLTCI